MGTVNQIAMAIAMGQGNVGIVWRANYKEFKDQLQLVEIPNEANIVKNLSIAVLKFSLRKERAVKFMNFVSSEKERKSLINMGIKQLRTKLHNKLMGDKRWSLIILK